MSDLPTVDRAEIAARLGCHIGNVINLVAAGRLPQPLPRAPLDPWLWCDDDALTAAIAAYHPNGRGRPAGKPSLDARFRAIIREELVALGLIAA